MESTSILSLEWFVSHYKKCVCKKKNLLTSLTNYLLVISLNLYLVLIVFSGLLTGRDAVMIRKKKENKLISFRYLHFERWLRCANYWVCLAGVSESFQSNENGHVRQLTRCVISEKHLLWMGNIIKFDWHDKRGWRDDFCLEEGRERERASFKNNSFLHRRADSSRHRFNPLFYQKNYFPSQQNAYICSHRKHINFYASQTRNCVFCDARKQNERKKKKKWNGKKEKRKVSSDSILKSPAEWTYWKNILWMVYHLRKTIILLSIPVRLYTRGLKVVSRFSGCSLFHKIFIEFSLALREERRGLFIDKETAAGSNIYLNNRFSGAVHSSIGLFGRVILSQQIRQWKSRNKTSECNLIFIVLFS